MKKLKEHLSRIHHQSHKLFCDHCDKFYYLKTDLSSHMKSHIPLNISAIQSVAVQRAIRIFECKECTKTFTVNKKLQRHITWAHTVRTIFCPICNVSQVSQGLLRKHILIYHERSTEKVCEMCGKTCLSEFLLKLHQQEVHEEKRFNCKVAGCNRKYSFKNQLENHTKTHTNMRDAVCPYEGCDKAYFEKRRLRQHIGLIHLNVRENCPIPQCRFSVGRYDYMRTHLRKHELTREQLDHYLSVVKAMKLM